MSASVLHRLLRKAGFRRPAQPLVLLYHRIAEPEVDPWGLCVSPRHFEEHLDVVKQRGPVLTFAAAVAALRQGTLPRHTTVLTFDDGYADNFHAASPLLESAGVPATFFITTGTLGGAQEFWWDALERLLIGPHSLPTALRLTLGAETHLWNLVDGAPAETPPNWLAWESAPTPRHALYYNVWQELLKTSAPVQDAALKEILAWSGVASAPRATHRTMTTDEVARLAHSPLVEIGAHTVTHPALPLFPVSQQRSEIEQSKADLECLLDRRVTTFSYPYGRYGGEARACVAEAGFYGACTTEHRAVQPDADPFTIPRIQIMNGDGDMLARQIALELRTY